MSRAGETAIGVFILAFLLFGSLDAYDVSTVGGEASITGKVVFKGNIPEPKKLLITKDEAVCGKGYVERHEIKVAQGGGLNDVVVILEGISKGKPWANPAEGYLLDQKRCTFIPYLQVVPNGANLTLLNSDPHLHNIHAYELIGGTRRTLSNIALPNQGDKVTKTIKPRRGREIRVECDAHDWMLGWLYVVDNPYYALVGKDGAFKIQAIPPGKYKLKAWHPFLGIVEREVSLSAKGEEQIVFEFKGK